MSRDTEDGDLCVSLIIFLMNMVQWMAIIILNDLFMLLIDKM